MEVYCNDINAEKFAALGLCKDANLNSGKETVGVLSPPPARQSVLRSGQSKDAEA